WGVDRRVVGGVDHGLADADELAADGEIVDGAAVILGVDDGGGVRGGPSEILRDRKLTYRLFGLEEGFERDGGRTLSPEDQLCGSLVEPRMERIIKMSGLEEARDAIDRFVVDQDRAEQGLLSFNIVRRFTENRRLGLRPWENQCRAHEQP